MLLFVVKQVDLDLTKLSSASPPPDFEETAEASFAAVLRLKAEVPAAAAAAVAGLTGSAGRVLLMIAAAVAGLMGSAGRVLLMTAVVAVHCGPFSSTEIISRVTGEKAQNIKVMFVTSEPFFPGTNFTDGVELGKSLSIKLKDK